jgi:hypothetical protein
MVTYTQEATGGQVQDQVGKLARPYLKTQTKQVHWRHSSSDRAPSQCSPVLQKQLNYL